MTVRGLLYWLARLLGDVQAIRRGRYFQRVVRKAALRRSSGFINRWFR